MNNEITILLGYIDNSIPILESSILTPIQLGKIQNDIELNMVSDSQGENISLKFIYYSELTGIYWAWKNLDNEYIGFFSPNYLLNINQLRLDSSDLSELNPDDIIKQLGIDKHSIDKHLMNYEILIANLDKIDSSKYSSVYNYYSENYIQEHLSVLKNLIYRKHPEYINALKYILEGLQLFHNNVFIMKKEIFNEYCQWIFPLLLIVEKQINFYEWRYHKDSSQSTMFKYLNEILLTTFIYQKLKNKVSIKYFDKVKLSVSEQQTILENLDSQNKRNNIALNFKNNMFSSVPSVSVIMAVYNTSQYLDQAVQSVLQQTLKNIEIIIVNDGSTDNSLDIIKKYAFIDQRIKVIDKKNAGLGFCRNSGLIEATGDYVHFMDSDDFMDETFLMEMYQTAIKNQADIVLANYKQYIDANSIYPLNHIHYSVYVLNASTNAYMTPAILINDVAIWNKIFNRNFVLRFPFIKEGGEDFEHFWRTMPIAKSICISKSNLYNYRKNPNSVQKNSKYHFEVLNTAWKIEEKFKRYFIDMKFYPYWHIFKFGMMQHHINMNYTLYYENNKLLIEYFKIMELLIKNPIVVIDRYQPFFACFASVDDWNFYRNMNLNDFRNRVIELYNKG